MALKMKQEYSTLKLTLPSAVVAEFKAVRQAVEAAGYEFDVADELAQVLKQMKDQLLSAASQSGSAAGGAESRA